MKVQRKVSPHREWDVVEQSRSFYIVSDGSPNGEGPHYTLSKAEYEPVQGWVDVSYECTLEASAHGAYSIYRLGYLIQTSNTRHRVTCTGSTFKVEVLK